MDEDAVGTLKVLEAAMAVLDLDRKLKPSLLAGLQRWPAFVAAAHHVVDELGFGDGPDHE